MTTERSNPTAPANRPADEPALTENGRKVMEARYLKKNEAGECIETPGTLLRRVARTVADVELTYGADDAERGVYEDQYYHLMASGRFMPNSPTLMNAGREMGMLSACFVLPVRDSIVDIFDSIKFTALIQKAGGGTGFAFDELRPTGDFIKSSGGTTSGPITFWRAFSEATNAIQQGAFRRGANMGMMYIHHPDILKFLHAKQDLQQFTNYNISVKITDTWMEEFRDSADSPHAVRNPRDGKAFVIPKSVDIWGYDIRDLIEIDCVEPVSRRGKAQYYTSPRLVGEIPAELKGKVYTKRDIWNIIVGNAWETGEPGVVFMDRINEHNPTPLMGRIEATNPCGEQPLLPYEACNLGSVNLGLFVNEVGPSEVSVDWDGLRETVHLATRFLDNVIDANQYPLKEIDEVCKGNRKIGLGIMGFADALFKLGVPYDSDEGVAWGERFMKFVDDEAHNASEKLAEMRGCFPNWVGSTWQTKHERRLRNAAVTTVAPTGTISIIANCSGGIEPLFSIAFIRNVLRGQKYGDKPLVEVNDTFRRVAERRGCLSDELIDRLAREGTLAKVEGFPEDLKRVFVCAHDVCPEWHMRMQATFQRHCDSSISKTINFPHDATREEVAKIYHLAYELGCKGVTVYRDGCRQFQPMALKKDDRSDQETDECSNDCDGQGEGIRRAREERSAAEAAASDVSKAAAPTYKTIEPADLPEIVSGFRIRQMTPFGNMHVKITVNPRADRELEVFAQLGKGGDVANSDLEGTCRMVSLWLRAGGSLRHVIKQLEGIGSSVQIPTRAGRITSLPDGLACALKKYMRAKERFGLRAILLGEIDPADLDRPPRPAPHDRMPPALDRTITATPSVAPRQAAKPGDGGGNGNGSAGGNGNGGGRKSRETLSNSRSAATTHAAESDDVLETVALAADAQPADPVAALALAGAQAAAASPKKAGNVRHHHDAAPHYILRCPQCGGVIARQEGCNSCASQCGWSAC